MYALIIAAAILAGFQGWRWPVVLLCSLGAGVLLTWRNRLWLQRGILLAETPSKLGAGLAILAAHLLGPLPIVASFYGVGWLVGR